MSALVSRRSTRKRRHSHAFSDAENEEKEHPNNAEKEAEEPISEEKEAEIWDSFREEHFETIEQLPLSLHRQFTLMKELEEYVQDNQKQLLPGLQEYINIRRSLSAMTKPQTPPIDHDISPDDPVNASEGVVQQNGNSNADRTSSPLPALSDYGHDAPMEVDSPAPDTKIHASIPHNRQTEPNIPSQTPPSLPAPKNARQLLMRIACLSEEIMRHSEEKVNLAQAAYDSVDRHIKLIDQAIIEQETALLKGPSTDVGANLPDIRPPDDGSVHNKKGSRGLTLKLPAAPIEEEDDTDGKVYCYCRKGFFGSMVGCDNPNCKVEWFHLECVGLKKLPGEHETWYCKDCVGTPVSKKRVRKR